MTTRVVHFQLRTCVWEITAACCFKCSYCGSGAGTPREHELSTEECVQVAHQLGKIGCRRVSLIGGEVFMRDDWPIIVRSLRDQRIRVSIITNGYLLSKEQINNLKKLEIESVAVSIDGPEKLHDSYRQVGSFNRCMNAIDCLCLNEIPVSVITTLHNRNYSHLEELYDILKTKNIFAWQLQACCPMGNASQNALSTEIDFKAVIDFVVKHLKECHFAIGIADNIGYFTSEEGFIRGNTSGKACFRGCRAGLTTIGIDSIGNIRGCESMYDDFFIEGNLREKSLYDIWNNPDSFSYNRNYTPELLSGKCKNCEYGNQCAGGCRSYNYFSHRKLYESLYCAKQKVLL